MLYLCLKITRSLIDGFYGYTLAEQSEKYHNGDINRDEYDKWRYNYPKYDEASGISRKYLLNMRDHLDFLIRTRILLSKYS